MDNTVVGEKLHERREAETDVEYFTRIARSYFAQNSGGELSDEDGEKEAYKGLDETDGGPLEETDGGPLVETDGVPLEETDGVYLGRV